MNKIYTLLLILLSALCVQSCKKDGASKPANDTIDKPVNETKTYLVSKITIHQQNADFVEQYTYDNKDRLIKAAYVGKYEYNYTYDTEDRLVMAQRNDYIDHLDTMFIYQYSANKILAFAAINYKANPADAYNYEVTNGRITKAVANSGDVYSYSYDTKGNIIRMQEIDSESGNQVENEFYTYDDKNGPFSMVKGNNLHFMFIGMKPNYSINNKTYNYFAGHVIVNYKYNDAGFPVQGSVAINNRPEKIDYEYIVK